MTFSSVYLIAAGHAVVLSDPEVLMYWSYRYAGEKMAFSMKKFLGSEKCGDSQFVDVSEISKSFLEQSVS